ncbi:hypothetical protein ACFBZI_11170 [Moraxella sp. ZJ142]|uniref:hypothetical protein n=1 Tax=Moraxella marmotae TaxID=3344520 RepID=UPI0035D43695
MPYKPPKAKALSEVVDQLDLPLQKMLLLAMRRKEIAAAWPAIITSADYDYIFAEDANIVTLNQTQKYEQIKQAALNLAAYRWNLQLANENVEDYGYFLQNLICVSDGKFVIMDFNNIPPIERYDVKSHLERKFGEKKAIPVFF